ncbi:MAG: hypothetical protein J7M25_07020 [Deltaproteobacteria bacterium]|nr:hypothetical protein [Deltaproteobacteria bacterium]
MALHFDETMIGTVEAPQGTKAFSFIISADSPSLSALGGWGAMTLTGVATIEGIVQDAPLLAGSSLEIGLPFHRYLKYQLAFRDNSGETWRFFGQKTPTFQHPFRSMTTLRGELFRNGRRLGAATVHFRFLDLPRFLASWRLKSMVGTSVL